MPAPTLRAWERRYGVPTPQRGDSGYRLYSPADERSLRSMVALIDGGLAPAEAARRIRARGDAAPAEPESSVEEPVVAAMRDGLLSTLLAFDEEGATRHLDRATGALSVGGLVSEVVLPVMREIGERWARDEISIGHEHFASAVVRGRLLALARGWGGGDGPLALLACPSGERHDLGVICFGLLLRLHGWRVFFLGADTPAESIVSAAAETRPDVVVVFAMYRERLDGIEPELASIAAGSALVLAGPGSDTAICRRVGAANLEGDPVAAAAALAA